MDPLWLREGVFEELLRCLDVLRRRTSIYKNNPEAQREEQREEQLRKEPPHLLFFVKVSWKDPEIILRWLMSYRRYN
jgi:hypothetical protein